MPARPRGADPAGVVARLVDWTRQEALPLWACAGYDHARGGFVEQLDPAGRPEPGAPRRVRVQARQIYVYAHAARLGWYPDGTRLALAAFARLLETAHAPDGRPGFVHQLDADGTILDATRDLYDHAFLLLATGWLAAVSGDAQVRGMVDTLLGFLDEALGEPDGSYREAVPPALPRRQNPHMHLFEAMLALHEMLHHPEALPRAARLRALMETRFVADCRLYEFFGPDWTRLPGAAGRLIEPGHHAEWAWLLRRHEALAGLAPSPLPDRLLEGAAAMAEPATGLLPDERHVENGGIAPLAAEAMSFRTWPQTEFAKAWLAAAEAGRPGAADRARAALANLERFYLAPAPRGAWIDRITADGRMLSGPLPASTFYHLFVAIAEADRVLGSSPQA